MNVSVFRKAHFNAAHRLYRKDWSDEKNREVFGLCANPYYHGHNYNLTVEVNGPINPETGYVIDLKDLKDIIREEVEDRYDHKNLNEQCPEFEDKIPTAENIVVEIWQRMRQRLSDNLKLIVTLYETERNFVQFDGNGL